MKKEFRDLFYSEKYDEIIRQTKELVRDKDNDSELWYCLFLAENNNYIDIDFDNINNEICFNKAIQLANKRQREEYNSEYNLFKDLSKYPDLRKIVRYAEFGNYSKVIEYFNKMDDEEIKLPEDNDIYSNLDYCFCTVSSPEVIDCCLLVTNLLYIKTKKEGYLTILNDLIGKSTEANTGLSPYNINYDLETLLSKAQLLVKFYKRNEVVENIDRMFAKIDVNLTESKFSEAEEIINDILEKDSNSAKAYWYLVLIKNQATSYEALVSKYFDIEKDVYFIKARKLADDTFIKFLDDVIKTFNHQKIYEETLEIIKDKPLKALRKFESLEDFKDSKKFAEECKEIIYQEAKKLSPKYAIKQLNEIINYKDSAKIIEEKEKETKIAWYIRKWFEAIIDYFYYNDGAGANIILSILGFGFLGYYILSQLFGLPSPLSLVPMIIYNVILLASLFFIVDLGIGEYEYEFYKIPLSLVCVLMIVGTEFSLIPLLINGISMLIYIIVSSIKQKNFNGTLALSLIFSLILAFINYMKFDNFKFIPFVCVVITALIVNYVEDEKLLCHEELSCHFSTVCGAFIIWILIDSLITGDYQLPYQEFNWNRQIFVDLLGLSMVFSAISNFSNSGISKFGSYVWYIRFGLNIISILLISLSVILGKYNEYTGDINFYGIYFYMLIPIAITIALSVSVCGSGQKHGKVFNYILVIILVIVALTFLWKTFSALTGCGVVEGCEQTTVFQGCDDLGQSIGAIVVQLVLAILYFASGTCLQAIESD